MWPRIDLISTPLGFLAVLLGFTAAPVQPSDIQTVPLVPTWDSPWVQRFTAPDPVVEGLVQQYLQTLATAGWATEAQGVWLQVGSTPIAHHQGTVPLSAASLSKIATTLAALAEWSPDHHFETRLGMTGTLDQGVLQGDLIVLGGSDPLFVWEEGIVLGNALQQLGIQRVTGNLVMIGDFAMNFQTDPAVSGETLRQSWNAALWPAEALAQYQALPGGTPQPALSIEGGIQVIPPEALPQDVTWLIRHRSLPLVAILKAMNIYSNNVMAEMVADLVGGPTAVVTQATQAARLSPGELNLINGSGLGEENQITPHAVVTMLMTLQEMLQPGGFSVADVLPIAGEDGGTLENRQIPMKSAVKTGSLAEVSALAGFIPTQERGPVWFAIINRGWALEELRIEQDNLLNAVQAHWGATDAPATLQAKVKFLAPPYQLGDPSRNERLP